jgi:hypothetical protein
MSIPGSTWRVGLMVSFDAGVDVLLSISVSNSSEP